MIATIGSIFWIKKVICNCFYSSQLQINYQNKSFYLKLMAFRRCKVWKPAVRKEQCYKFSIHQ